MSRTRIVVHTSTFAKARQLGNQMADDPQIRPHLKNLAQYSGYFRFRLAHRAHLEATPRFEHYYLEKVYALADREVKLQRIPRTDAVESWDRWYHLYVHPIKTIMWQTWEHRMKLEARYLDALLLVGVAEPEDIKRMTANREPDPDELPGTIPEKTGLASLPSRIMVSLTGGLGLFRPTRPAIPRV